MALTATEEALVRDLIAQEDELLSLAANEPTIISKLGATKVTLSDLVAASAGNLTDLFLTRQGTDDKSMTMDLLRQFVLAQGAVTPPQFDNDTSLATTEFVRRAGIQSSGFEAIESSRVLVNSDAGKSFLCQAAGNFTVTLPLASHLPVGTRVEIFCAAPNVTIAKQGVEAIHTTYQTLGAVESLTINGGESLLLIANSLAGGWMAVGQSQLYAAPQFKSSLGVSGYQKLPSGLIIQWGSFTALGGATTTLNLPIAFTTAGYAITANFGIPAAGNINTGFTGLTQYRVQNTHTGNQSAMFIAVGR